MSLNLPDLDWVTVDTESSGLHPDDGARVACVALASSAWSIALPFDQGTRDKFPVQQLDLLQQKDPNLGESEWWELLEWLSARKLVFHNAKHDLTLLNAGTRHWPGRDLSEQFRWDTMVAQRELDPLDKAGLDAVGERMGLGGKSNEALKTWLRKNKHPVHRYDLVPWDIIEEYVTGDGRVTATLFGVQRKRVETDHAIDPARLLREFDLTRTLFRMELRGVEYDAVRSLEAAEMLERRADEIEARMPFKCDPAAAKRYFFGELALEPDRRTEKRGDPVLDEEQVRAFISEGVEWAREYSIVSKARRAVSMWYRGYPEKMGPDGRLRTVYKQTWVKSGRMSVERVQLQAMPKSDKRKAVGSDEVLEIFQGVPDVRTLVHAREGFGLWNLDLSQAELRVAAKYAGCQTMLDLLAQGADIHGRTCEEVMHVSRDDPFWKTKRDIAKRLTFGSIFQIGGEKFQATLSKLADIHLPVAECDVLVRGWRRLYPEFGQAYRKAERTAIRNGYVRVLPNTEYEIRSYFGPLDWAHTAWNRIVQGSLAEFFKLWMVAVEQECPGRMVLTVHDSVLMECPLDEGDEVASVIAAQGAAMATEIFKTPMKVDVDYWGDRPVDKSMKGDDQYQGVA